MANQNLVMRINPPRRMLKTSHLRNSANRYEYFLNETAKIKRMLKI
jgi:hypothetical protein